jgi:hypothetical protein
MPIRVRRMTTLTGWLAKAVVDEITRAGVHQNMAAQGAYRR